MPKTTTVSRHSKKTLAFQFKSRQTAWSNSDDFCLKVQTVFDRSCDRLNQVLDIFCSAARIRFHFDLHMLHRSHGMQLDTEFGYEIEPTQDSFQAGREDVVSANCNHVVRSTKDSAFRPKQLATTRARFRIDLDQVTGSVTDKWRSGSTQIGHDQFSLLIGLI